jgi:hypothetical protein
VTPSYVGLTVLLIIVIGLGLIFADTEAPTTVKE